jgi:NADPH-dependent 2,4-dienoyl-CoA reductase/sulfur reductase-like enzyme/rhodanese-related sulfurtransferase/nitrogen-specific signal transduction histidine kinase
MQKPDLELKKLKKSLKEYKAEIERLIKEKNEYLVVSAHQMKSPLSTIIFSINTLIGEYAGKLNSKQLGIVASIKRSANTLQSLIGDIIELEKLRTGKVEFENIDFVETSVQAIEELRDKLQEKGIKFEVNLPNKVLIIKGHKLGIKQVVYNLIENAVKYSFRDGEVGFVVEYDEKDKIIKATVKDRGIGIPKEEQENIFKEFYRAPNARQFDITGTGFGMVIVKQVLDFCSGNINLKSKKNEGTQITFTLPLLEVNERRMTIREEKAMRRKIVIVGGITAGPKAASRARRLDPTADITIFEKENFLAYAGCTLPYYLTGHLKTQRDLSEALSNYQGGIDYFRNVKSIDIKNLCEVTKIDRTGKVVHYKDLMTNQEHTMPYDSLILTTGGKPVIPEIIGVNLQNIFVLHGIQDSEKIKTALASDSVRDIVILGGGLIGVEIAEALTVSGAKVTIIEKMDQILQFMDTELSALVEKHMRYRGIRILKNESISAFIGKKRVQYVQLSRFRLPADLVILGTGINPNVGLAVQAGLNKGPTGAIAVNELLQTNDPSIYAAGDCAEVRHVVLNKPYYLPLGSIANRMGRIAGGNATGKQLLKFSPVTGTIIIKVFDYHVGKTGLSEKDAQKAGFDVVTCYVPEYDRERFIPGAEIINIKMIADRKDKRLLGVQIVGKGDVAKRIDIAAMVISKKGKVDDILAVDLGYAPYYSNAVGAIVVAANVLQNKLDNLFEGISPGEVHTMLQNGGEGSVFLDVRTPQEYEEGKIPGFDLIPLESLRRRMDEILPNRKIILASTTGSRSFQAALILKSNGFKDVKVLEGGIRMWPYEISRE